ncbi:MAG: hypothetical protein WCI73_07270 [Phycisphaerae bacterium]
MVAPKPSNGYSARVRLELSVGDLRFPLAQIADDRIIFDQAVVLPGTGGVVLAAIDERERRWSAQWDFSEKPRQVVLANFKDF